MVSYIFGITSRIYHILRIRRIVGPRPSALTLHALEYGLADSEEFLQVFVMSHGRIVTRRPAPF